MYRTRLCAVCVTPPPPAHGASEHALHWPQGAAFRRTRPAAARCAQRVVPCAHAYASAFASHRFTV
eukprot:4806229-Pleurochrysis_carterae.AAC.1